MSAGTVEDVISQRVGETTLEGQQLLRKLRFGRDVQLFEQKKVTELSLCPTGSAPKWDAAEERFGSAEVVDDLRKGYHKGGSTDPRLLHPINSSRSRLFTGAEHARIKGVDPRLLLGASETTVHQVCGQAVDVRPVRAIGQRIGQALQRLAADGDQERKCVLVPRSLAAISG